MVVVLQKPRTDRELVDLLGISPWQLEKVVEYIEKGHISLEFCDCAGGDIGCPNCNPEHVELREDGDGLAGGSGHSQ